MSDGRNIIFCGVGGQGILLASEVTAHALIKAGFDVKKSEVHGMAQRGGSVVAHLRFGQKVHSPLIEPGTADFEVSFELLESVRYLPYLNRDSRVIVNTLRIAPPAVATGKALYPAGLLEEFRRRRIAVFPVEASAIAAGIGERRAGNLVLVGALSSFLPVDEKAFHEVMSEKIRPQFLAANRRAFAEGRALTMGGNKL